MSRERLPDRTPRETFNVEHAGMKYSVTISQFADGRVGETFIANHKRGNASDVAARDCGIRRHGGRDLSPAMGGGRDSLPA
jgi:hypothetical protein